MQLPTRLLRRKIDAHKGDFGHILVLAGSRRYSGAAVLCCVAAMRSGAGLVTLGLPEELNNPIIKIKPKEVMTLPLPQTGEGGLSFKGYRKIEKFIKDIDVLVIGPGLGRDPSTQRLVRKIILKSNKPMVIDADGLNALINYLDILNANRYALNPKILTPHPGELARLLNTDVKRIQAERENIAEKFAKDYKVVLVLKGHNTVVVDYRGNRYINKSGNPGMATAGSGDVLTGIIASFLAQGLGDFESAKYAVYLHGLAGDLAAREKTQLGMIASDIIDYIPLAIKKCS